MNEDFVPFELAKKLKEKGFDCEYPFAMYNKYEQFCPLYSSDKDYFGINDFDKHAYIAPTISQVLKWLRKEKKIYVLAEVEYEDWFEYKIVQTIEGIRGTNTRVYETYDEAILAGIEYVIDNLL